MKHFLFMLVTVFYLSLPSFALNSASLSSEGNGKAVAPPPLSISCSKVIIDQFTDNNFNANPVWSGNTGQWNTQTGSNGGPTGSGVRVIRVEPGGNNAGTFVLTTPISTWHTNQEWIFWMGRTRATSGTNRVRFWLFSNTTSVQGNSASGYCIEIGDAQGAQEFRILRVESGVVTNTVLTSSQSIPTTANDYGVGVRVVRNELGQWELYTSVMPTTNPSGINPSSNIVTETNVLQGFGTDNTIIPDGLGYIGMAVTNGGGNATQARDTEFDHIYFTPCNPRTNLSFSATGVNVEEDAGSISITAQIANPHPTIATTAQLVISLGDAALVNNYTTQTITFPAGSSANQTVNIQITDDPLCIGAVNAVSFALQNVSGGYAATSSGTFNLLINDNELLSANILEEDFETGDASDWWSPVTGSFTASNTGPVNGSYSLRHVNQGQNASGATSTAISMNGASLAGSNSTWRFNVRYFNQEPNTTNYFIICLTNDQQDIAFETIDGYAVGVRPSGSFNQDWVTLWRTEGDILYPIITTLFDWNNTNDKVGFEITRSAEGLWTLSLDGNGDFDNLVPQGSAVDTFWDYLGYFGPFLVYNTSTIGNFSMDDISFTQESCQRTLYSQGTGLSNTALWAQTPVGTPASFNPGPFTTMIVQGGHDVTFTGNTLCRNLEVQPSGILNAGSASINLRGNFVNNGSFQGGTSTVRLEGNTEQTLGGTGTTTFFNLELQNNAGASLLNPMNIQGQLRAQLGTFNTNNQLRLVSNATGTGSIGTIQAGADVIGQITLQRYLPPAPQYWVYLSNPLQNQTISNWNDEIVTTGFPGSDYPSYNFNSIYHYDETQPGDRNTGWVGATNVTNALDPMRGYIVYMNGNANTVIASGNFMKGNVSVPLSYNDLEPGTGYFNPDGWNLISNVYPSAIDWVSLKENSNSWSSGNGTYYVYDAAGSNYRAYNANVLSGTANRYIASSQAFFVQASGTGQTMNFAESIKSTTSAAFQRNTEEASLVRFNLVRGTMDDEIVLTIKEGATLGFDELFDAIKWNSPVNTAPELAFVAPDDSKLTIQAIDAWSETIEIPVYAEMPQTGNYTFTISQVQNLPVGVCITIEDLVSGTILPIAEGETMTINNTAAYTGNRFIIRMTPALNALPNAASCFDANDGSIQLSSAINSWTVTAQDVMGNIHYAENGVITGLAAGDYTVMVENSDALCPATLIGITIPQPDVVASEISMMPDRCNSGNMGRIELMVENADIFNYAITNGQGETVMEGSVADNYKLVSGLPYGVYSVQIESECHNETYNVDLTDPFAVSLDLVINTPSLTLQPGETVNILADAISNTAIQYVWTVNGFDGGDQPALNFAVNNAGIYNITCVASTAQCSATAFTAANVELAPEEEEEEEEVLSTEELETQALASVVRMGNAVVVSFQNASSSKAKIAIYNATGKLVMQVNGYVSAQQVRTIDITGLASGMYVVHVEQDQKILAKQQVIK